MKKQTINPTEWYSMNDIIAGQLFPWCKGTRVVRRIIQDDLRSGHSILKSQVTGMGRGTKYRIYGRNLIRFIEKVEQGKITP
jgi:hypothetical protein